jgi:hypothetical protein
MTTETCTFLVYCALFAALCAALFGPLVWRLRRRNLEKLGVLTLIPTRPTGLIDSGWWAWLARREP